MGMFDEVYINCPGCGNLIRFQSKSGRCMLDEYHITSIPPEVLNGLIGRKNKCNNCGRIIKITDPKEERIDGTKHIELEFKGG